MPKINGTECTHESSILQLILVHMHMSVILCLMLKWLIMKIPSVGKKCFIFTESFFSVDFMFGNFPFKFLGALHHFKIFFERNLKSKPLPQLINIRTASSSPKWPNIRSQYGVKSYRSVDDFV